MPVTALALTPPDSGWMRSAACVGRWDVMEGESDEAAEAAMRFCAACPVRADCLRWVLSLPPRDDVDGIAGGLTRDERRKARRSKRRSGTFPQDRERHIPEERECLRCELTKPRTEFYEREAGKGGLYPYCRPCHRERQAERRAAKAAANEQTTDVKGIAS